MNSQQQIAALVAERNSAASRVIGLEGIAHAALLDGKKPQKLERLRSEVNALRSRVRALDLAINKSDA